MALAPIDFEAHHSFQASAASALRRAAERIIYAPCDCLITHLHVRPHQQVILGDPLCDVVYLKQDGEKNHDTLTATDRGVIKPIEGSPVFSQAWDDGSIVLFIREGEPLFVITREATGHEAGTIKGLTPRPTRVMYLRKQRLIKSYQKKIVK